MYVDKLLEFSDGQAVTATGLSENVANIFVNGSPNPVVDAGAGEPLWLVVSLAQPGATGTLNVALETSDQSDMTGSTVLLTSGAVDLSTVKGNIVAVRLPLGDYKKYLAVRYTATNPADLFVNAFITTDIDANRAYAAGSTIV